MDQLIDIFWAVLAAKQFTYMVVLTMVGAICWVLVALMQLPTLAVMFAPILLFSGLAANHFAGSVFYLPFGDKDANVAIASAIGVLGALLLLLATYSLVVLRSDRKARRIEGRNIALAREHNR